MTAAKVMDIIPDCRVAMDKQQSQYRLIPKSKKEDAHKLFLKIPNVQILGFVYHDTNGLNHGPVWKMQLFFSNGICTVILWQDYYGKGNLRKSLLKHGWEKVSNWE